MLNTSMLTFKDFQKKKDDTKSLDVIRKGMNLQSSGDFWKDLLSLCGNAQGMADLLDVPKEKITALAGRVSTLRSKIEDSEDTNIKDRLIKTGNKT